MKFTANVIESQRINTVSFADSNIEHSKKSLEIFLYRLITLIEHKYLLAPPAEPLSAILRRDGRFLQLTRSEP